MDNKGNENNAGNKTDNDATNTKENNKTQQQARTQQELVDNPVYQNFLEAAVGPVFVQEADNTGGGSSGSNPRPPNQSQDRTEDS